MEAEQIEFYGELRAIGEERRYNPKWAAAMFKAKHSQYPPLAWNNLPTVDPSTETRDWIREYYADRREERERAAKQVESDRFLRYGNKAPPTDLMRQWFDQMTAGLTELNFSQWLKLREKEHKGSKQWEDI
jgi:hypothetical protein